MQRLVILLTAFLFLACSPDQGHLTGQVESWLIQDTSIIDVRSGSVVPHRSVLIEGDRIAAIAPASDMAAPAGARTIDGSGKFLIPGLWDTHIHTVGDAETRNAILPLLIANGVTSARSMAADCHSKNVKWADECVTTIDDVNKWRQAIADGTLVGPRIVAASFYTEGPDSPETSSINEPGTEEHARAYTRLLNDRGVDFIKIYSGLNREAYFAVADEARALGLEIAGHVPFAVRASEASDTGLSTVEHITGFLEECSSEEERLRPVLIASYSSSAAEFWATLIRLAETFDVHRCSRLYNRLVTNGTWLVPTLSVEGFYTGLESPRGDWRDDPRLKYVPRSEVEAWNSIEKSYFEGIEDYKTALQPHFQKSFEIAGESHRAGVPMLAGSDAGEYGIIWGFSLHDELEYMVAAGLGEADVLRTATMNPALYRGMDSELGTIEEGKIADLVLLNANPLDDISNTKAVDTVIANGRVFGRDDLDELLLGVEAYVSSTWDGDSTDSE